MSLGITAAGWAAIGTTAVAAYSADRHGDAADAAAAAQGDAARAGMSEQQGRFDSVLKLLQPYVDAGTGALAQQKDLVGLGSDPRAQQAAIDAIMRSPQFTSAQKLGEGRILANASATGGLRGGNTQAALAQFNPSLLASAINDQYGRLGGLVSIGQNAAAGVGNAGMATGNQISGLLQQLGASQAGGALAGGRQQAGYAGAIGQGLGMFAGLGGFRSLGSANGGTDTLQQQGTEQGWW